MPQHGIFIAYAHEDENLAIRVRNSLERINEFRPYLAADYPVAGENFKEKIMNAIWGCNFFIVFLTESGIKSQWVNQELGYACRVKKHKSNFRIIPVTKHNLDLKGFITTDTQDVLFLDDYNFDFLLVNMFIQIRSAIPNAHKLGALNVKFSCPSCIDKVGLPLQLLGKIPSHEDYMRVLDQDTYEWDYPCNRCQRKISIKLTTFEQIKTQETYRDPFTEKPFRLDPRQPR